MSRGSVYLPFGANRTLSFHVIVLTGPSNYSTFTTIKRDIDWRLAEPNDRIRGSRFGATTELQCERIISRMYTIQGRVNKVLRHLDENSRGVYTTLRSFANFVR